VKPAKQIVLNDFANQKDERARRYVMLSMPVNQMLGGERRTHIAPASAAATDKHEVPNMRVECGRGSAISSGSGNVCKTCSQRS